MTQLPARMPDETEWEYAAFITYLTRTRSVEEATDVHQARIDRVVLDHPPIPIPIPTGAVRVTLTPQTTTVTIPGPEGASVVIATEEPDAPELVMPRWAAGFLLGAVFGYRVIDGAQERERISDEVIAQKLDELGD